MRDNILRITIGNIRGAIASIEKSNGHTTLDLTNSSLQALQSDLESARNLANAIKSKNFHELILNDCDISKEFAGAFFMELLRDNNNLKIVRFAGINMPPFMALVNAMSRYPGITHLSFGGSEKLEEVGLANRIDNTGIYAISPLITDTTRSRLVEVDFGSQKGLYTDLSVLNLVRSMISKNTPTRVKAYGFDAIFNFQMENERNKLMAEQGALQKALDAKKKGAAPALPPKPPLGQRISNFFSGLVKSSEQKAREKALREQALTSRTGPMPRPSAPPMAEVIRPSAPPMPMPDTEAPDEFLCPITLEIMQNPVTLQCSGRTYEKNSIVEHVRRAREAGQDAKCPTTNIVIPHNEPFVVNLNLQAAIKNYVEQQDYLKRQHAPQITNNSQPQPSAPTLDEIKSNNKKLG